MGLIRKGVGFDGGDYSYAVEFCGRYAWPISICTAHIDVIVE